MGPVFDILRGGRAVVSCLNLFGFLFTLPLNVFVLFGEPPKWVHTSYLPDPPLHSWIFISTMHLKHKHKEVGEVGLKLASFVMS